MDQLRHAARIPGGAALGVAVRKDQPEWAGYLSARVTKWAKDGTILDLETKDQIRHSKFAEDAHRKASASSGN